jgi:hypothetical protein
MGALLDLEQSLLPSIPYIPFEFSFRLSFTTFGECYYRTIILEIGRALLSFISYYYLIITTRQYS